MEAKQLRFEVQRCLSSRVLRVLEREQHKVPDSLDNYKSLYNR